VNRYHRRLCGSDRWADHMESNVLPHVLGEIELGDDVLEVGPGYGAATRVLAGAVPRLTALEIDRRLADRLRTRLAEQLGSGLSVVDGDGTDMPFDDGRFSAVACFTMLHHVPSRDAQDRMFAECARVLRPDGVFAGRDLTDDFRSRLIHIGDTYVPVAVADLADRFEVAGFRSAEVTDLGGAVSFAAYR
jgi:SAM-dependent methyltransferase